MTRSTAVIMISTHRNLEGHDGGLLMPSYSWELDLKIITHERSDVSPTSPTCMYVCAICMLHIYVWSPTTAAKLDYEHPSTL